MLGTQLGTYRQVHTSTADPPTLLVLLYEGAVRALRKGIRAVDAGDPAEYRRAVVRVNAIVGELSATLDHGTGGDIARNLDRLYGFVLGRLAAALAKPDRAPLEDALGVMRALHEGFQGAVETHRARRA